MGVKSRRKQVIFIANCGNPVFECAYFILKHGAEYESDEDEMIKEAERLANNILRGKKRRASPPGRKTFLRGFLAGAIAGAIVAAIIAAVVLLPFAS